MPRFRVWYDVGLEGWEEYEAIVDAKDEDEAKAKIEKFALTYELQPGMEGEPEMVNAQTETRMDTLHIEEVEEITRAGGRKRLPVSLGADREGIQGRPRPFSRRVVGPEGYPTGPGSEFEATPTGFRKRKIGPGKGWHGERARHSEAAKKGRRK